MQTRLGSFTEACVNTAVGFGISYAANLAVLPLFGLFVTPAKAFWIGVIFTVISVVRSYYMRRIFNYIKFGNTQGEQCDLQP